jgi:hypothetical protein
LLKKGNVVAGSERVLCKNSIDLIEMTLTLLSLGVFWFVVNALMLKFAATFDACFQHRWIRPGIFRRYGTQRGQPVPESRHERPETTTRTGSVNMALTNRCGKRDRGVL